MLRIRFFRIGKKHQPFFKIVVTDKRKPPRGGNFVDEVGSFNPFKKETSLNAERIKYWISKGAKPSDSVYNLLIKKNILKGKKISLYKKKKGKAGESEKKEEVAPEGNAVEKKEKEPTETTPEIKKETPESNPVPHSETPEKKEGEEEIPKDKEKTEPESEKTASTSAPSDKEGPGEPDENNSQPQ